MMYIRKKEKNHLINERSDKTVKQFLTVLTALLLFGLMACEGPAGPAGPDGPAGKDGANGTNGADGKDGVDAGFVYFEGFKDSLKCASCHNPDSDTTYYIAGKAREWEESVHGSGTAWEENRSTCAECHTTEGFMMKVAGKTVTDIADPTPPGCFACHSPHSKGDFSLRSTSSQSLTSNITGVSATTFDLGNANLCVSCHRRRTISTSANNMLPDPTKTATTDTLKINTSRWYGHYGVQGQVLLGAGAVQFVDAAAYGKTTAHSSGLVATKGCATCHMADYSPANAYGAKIGGHTMDITYTAEGSTSAVEMLNGCKNCHTSSSFTKLDYNGVQTQFAANMDTLKSLLVTKGWMNTSDAILATSSNVLKIAPASRGGALFNYMMLLHDGSKGIHNPSYANDVLRASIAEMRK
jgi:hypothetical protein